MARVTAATLVLLAIQIRGVSMKSSASRADQSHGRRAKRDLDNESKQSRDEKIESECLKENEDIARLLKRLLAKE